MFLRRLHRHYAITEDLFLKFPIRKPTDPLVLKNISITSEIISSPQNRTDQIAQTCKCLLENLTGSEVTEVFAHLKPYNSGERQYNLSVLLEKDDVYEFLDNLLISWSSDKMFSPFLLDALSPNNEENRFNPQIVFELPSFRKFPAFSLISDGIFVNVEEMPTILCTVNTTARNKIELLALLTAWRFPVFHSDQNKENYNLK